MNQSRTADPFTAHSQYASAQWRIIGGSVLGAAHRRAGLPNQDAIRWQVGGDSRAAVLAVADGHGSTKCFRSDRGARFAVEVGTTAVAALVRRAADMPTLTAIKRLAEESWPREIVRLWAEHVNQDLSGEPFNEEELGRLEMYENTRARQSVEKNPLLAYGATLLTTVITDEYTIYLQLGDGDIMTVSESGEVTRPMVTDTRLFANETTSLCAEGAWRDFRFTFQAANGAPPALILCSTDGYAGSFRTDTDFLKVGSDLLDLVRAEGLDAVDSRIPSWLNEASVMGSGDDVTLGVVCRAYTSPPIRPDWQSSEKQAGDSQPSPPIPEAAFTSEAWNAPPKLSDVHESSNFTEGSHESSS